MRKKYDLSKGERGKFYGKVDTKNPIIETDGEISPKICEKWLPESEIDKLPMATEKWQFMKNYLNGDCFFSDYNSDK